ncbi:MAG: hypothetical protein GC136_02735 [Alphaproteobacteria bacterium]|nr:hypothetical protein [Alphaproteobacteria bacterium]
MAALQAHYDCDPGQDDAIALLYALGSPKIDIRSLSVVGGNVDVRQCAKNALQILELAGRGDIPVYTGAEKPLARPLVSLPEVFGETGMAGGEDLPLPQNAPRNMVPAQDFKTIASAPILVATGPLTNLALQIQNDPAFPQQIEELFIMGGCPFPEPVWQRMGNYKPDGASDYAEYNFACDPEAAKIVFRAGFKKITLVGLNVTRAVLYNSRVEAALRGTKNVAGLRAAAILSTVGEDDVQDYGPLRETPDDPVRALHDVIAMAAVDAPELFEFVTVPLRIVADPLPAPAGQSLIDAENYDHPSVRVAKTIDRNGFLRRLVDNIGGIK